jgi:DNA-binding NtrC family response regulator
MLEDKKRSLRERQLDVKTILVVEDDEDIGEALVFALTEEPSYHVIVAATGKEALQVASARKIDLFIIDYYLSGINGIELYDKLHVMSELEDVPALISSVNIEHLRQHLKARHLMGVGKPFDLDVLLEMVARALA